MATELTGNELKNIVLRSILTPPRDVAAKLAKALSEGLDPFVDDASGMSTLELSLRVCCDSCNPDYFAVPRILLESGAPRSCDWVRLGFSAVHNAIVRGDRSELETSMKSAGGPDGLESPMSPLHLAAILGNVQAAIVLIAAGAKVDSRDASGRTPFHCAVCAGSETMVRYLFACGASVQDVDGDGYSSIALAVATGNHGMLRCLVELGAELGVVINKPGPMNGFPLVAVALEHNRSAMIPDLSALGVDLESQRINGASLLHHAAQSLFRVGWTRALLELGFDPNEVDDKGNTPLHLAVMKCNEMDVRALMEADADPSLVNGEGLDAFELARKFDCEEIHDFMVEFE